MNELSNCRITGFEDDFFSVTFIDFYGNVISTITGIPFGTVFAIPPINQEIAGYIFDGWNTQPDGSGTFFLPCDVITITGNLIFYAIFRANELVITFDPNGGFGSRTSFITFYGQEFILPNSYELDFFRPGYEFAGWGTDPYGGNIYQPGEVFTVFGDIVFYAIWKPYLFRIIFDPNGGEGYPYDFHVYYDEYFTVPSPGELGFYRNGYRFIEWNTEPNGSGIAYQPGEALFVNSDLKLYAQWEQDIIYSVVFEPNGASGQPVEFFFYSGQILTFPNPEQFGFFRDGYEFIGWSTQPNARAELFLPGDEFIVFENVTFYAQWEFNEEPPEPPAECCRCCKCCCCCGVCGCRCKCCCKCC